MAKKHSWMKLDQYALKKDNLIDVARIVRQAYEDDLCIICGIKHAGVGTYNQ